MRLKEFIVPQEKIFFYLLSEQSQILVRGAEGLYNMLIDFQNKRAKAASIKEIEHAGDNVAHELYVKLNTTFVTPLDREDIMTVASRCDDVLDAIDGAAQRLITFDISEPTETMRSLGRLILKATREINLLMTNIKRADQKEVDKGCEEVDVIENQGDELLHAAIGELFRKNDIPVLDIIKLKEIYEWLESALDRCEDVTYSIADIVMKNK